MAYIVDPTDPTQPTGDKGATQGDDELRALKSYIQTLAGLGSGVNFFRKNAIIGGDFDTNPWQRGTNFVGIADLAYSADRWQYRKVGTVVEDINKVIDAPTVIQAGKLYINSLQMNITTADAAIAAGDFDYLVHVVEGYNWKPLAQVPIVLSFWHKHTRIGIYCVALRNAGLDRSYVAEYSQLVADTWESTTIIIPASPVAGAWGYTNGNGLIISFARSVGATFQTPPNIWTVGNFLGTANQVNSTDTIGNKFTITGVQLEKGGVASTFEQRTIQEESLLCERYYQKSFLLATAPQTALGVNNAEDTYAAVKAGATANNIAPYRRFSQKMRAPPTMALYNSVANNAQIRDVGAAVDCSASAAVRVTTNGFMANCTGNAATAIGNELSFHWTADAELSG